MTTQTGALGDADAHKAMVVTMKRDAAARAPPFHPCHPFPFSARPLHSAADIVLSPDRFTVTRPSGQLGSGYAWARSEQCVAAGCSVARWAVKLSNRSGSCFFKVGVASEAFKEYSSGLPKQVWYFQDTSMHADLRQHDEVCVPVPLAFAAGDVVAFQMERAPGIDGVLRVQVEVEGRGS